MIRPVTKWRKQVLTPRAVPDAVAEAFRQMRTGRPRPVYLELPPEATVETDEVTLRKPAPVSEIVPSPGQLEEVAQVIANAQLPLIFAGGGVARSNAEQALVELVEATNIPVITSGGGKGAIPDSHPLCYGSCVTPAGEVQEMNQLFEVMQAADVVIGIGTRFSLGNPAGEASTLININIDDSDLTRIQANTIPLHGDARATIEALIPHLVDAGAAQRPSPAEAVAAARRLIAYFDIREKEPQYPILEALQHGAPEDAFIVWGVTQFGYYARTHYQVNQPRTFIDSGYSFNLGYSFPTALGVKVAQPDRPVLCVVGDGGFMFNASELSTAVKYGINVVTIVFNNDSYGNVARDLDEFFEGTYETDLVNPNFRGICGVFWCRGDAGQRSLGTRDTHSGGTGATGTGDYRCPDRRCCAPSRPVDRPCLEAAMDQTPGGVDFSLTGDAGRGLEGAGHAAVDGDHGSSDRSGVRRAEPADRSGNLTGFYESSQRALMCSKFVDVSIERSGRSLQDRGAGRTRCNCI